MLKGFARTENLNWNVKFFIKLLKVYNTLPGRPGCVFLYDTAAGKENEEQTNMEWSRTNSQVHMCSLSGRIFAV